MKEFFIVGFRYRSGLVVLSGLIVFFAFFPGCAFDRKTEPARTAIEQLLLSTSADRALKGMDFSALKGHRVTIDPSYLESYDKAYVMGAIRDKVSASGADIVAKEKADIIVEPRCGALSIDGSRVFIGIPRIPIPIPMAGTVKTPEISLFKKIDQASIAKLAILAYESKSGRHVLSTEARFGKAYYNRWTMLIFFGFRTTDLPER